MNHTAVWNPGDDKKRSVPNIVLTTASTSGHWLGRPPPLRLPSAVTKGRRVGDAQPAPSLGLRLMLEKPRTIRSSFRNGCSKLCAAAWSRLAMRLLPLEGLRCTLLRRSNAGHRFLIAHGPQITHMDPNPSLHSRTNGLRFLQLRGFHASCVHAFHASDAFHACFHAGLSCIMLVLPHVYALRRPPRARQLPRA